MAKAVVSRGVGLGMGRGDRDAPEVAAMGATAAVHTSLTVTNASRSLVSSPMVGGVSPSFVPPSAERVVTVVNEGSVSSWLLFESPTAGSNERTFCQPTPFGLCGICKLVLLSAAPEDVAVEDQSL